MQERRNSIVNALELRLPRRIVLANDLSMNKVVLRMC